MRGGGREEVAAVEGARDGLERVRGVRELVRALDPAELRGGHEQAVVRPDEQPPFRVAEHERPARPPTPGSTTARCTPSGMYGSVFASTSAPCRTACGAIPCVMSMISRRARCA